MADSRWSDIFKHLSNNSIDVYPPAYKNGECKASYTVVKNDGLSQLSSYSTDIGYFSVMCYVPKGSYEKLEPYVEQVKGVMKGLEPMIIPTHQETPSFYDDTYKAHMISIGYKNAKKH